MQIKKLFAAVVLMAVIVFGSQSAFTYSTEYHLSQSQQNFAQQFLRTELYFGTDKNDGTQVSTEDWNKFLAEEVTPKFPDGFTVLEGFGQYRTSEGKIVREGSKVLVLLYPLKNQKSASRKIEQIRNAYKKAFQQESVMRMDIRQTVRVAF